MSKRDIARLLARQFPILFDLRSFVQLLSAPQGGIYDCNCCGKSSRFRMFGYPLTYRRRRLIRRLFGTAAYLQTF
jgi:hypothetical protein